MSVLTDFTEYYLLEAPVFEDGPYEPALVEDSFRNKVFPLFTSQQAAEDFAGTCPEDEHLAVQPVPIAGAMDALLEANRHGLVLFAVDPPSREQLRGAELRWALGQLMCQAYDEGRKAALVAGEW